MVEVCLWEFNEVCVAGAFPQGMFESFLLRKNLNLKGGNIFFPFMNILICSWTFIDALYCSMSHILFNAQIVSTLARGSPFHLAPVSFATSPLFFEHFFTLAQGVLGLSLFLFLIEYNLHIIQWIDLKCIVKRFWISVYIYITHVPNKDIEYFKHLRNFCRALVPHMLHHHIYLTSVLISTTIH